MQLTRLLGMIPPMAGTWKRRLAQVIAERPKISLKAASLAAGLNETALRDLLTKVEDPRVETLRAVCRVLGVPLMWLIEGDEPTRISIPIIGEVSAGESWEAYSEHDEDSGANETFVLDAVDPIGLRVRGRSMMPVYRDGDILVASRLFGAAAHNAINRDCIARTSKGEAYIKILRRGSAQGLFTLRSYNPAYDDIENVELEWVAPIRWVRRS